jgi:hypothetical protein
MKGKSHLIKENIIDALWNFKKASIYNQNDYPLYIYKGFSEFLIKDFSNALLSYQQALRLIENHKKLNDDEKSYLKDYIIENILHIFNATKEYKNYEKYAKVYKDLKFDIENIRKNFLYDFPQKV